MFYYITVDSVIVSKSTIQPSITHVESEEDYELGGTLVDDVYTAPIKTTQQQINELEASISARRWREYNLYLLYLTDTENEEFSTYANFKESADFVVDAQNQIEVLRGEL